MSAIDGRLRAMTDLARVIAEAGTGRSWSHVQADLVSAGATEHEILGTYIAVGPIVGAVRLVEAAPSVASLVGYDVDADLERPPT